MQAIKTEKEKRGSEIALFSFSFRSSLSVTSILGNNVKDAVNKIIFLSAKNNIKFSDTYIG